MPSSPGSVGLARAHPLYNKHPGYGAFPPDLVQLRSTLPVGALVLGLFLLEVYDRVQTNEYAAVLTYRHFFCIQHVR